jgi:hypothetical protein
LLGADRLPLIHQRHVIIRFIKGGVKELFDIVPSQAELHGLFPINGFRLAKLPIA